MIYFPNRFYPTDWYCDCYYCGINFYMKNEKCVAIYDNKFNLPQLKFCSKECMDSYTSNSQQ